MTILAISCYVCAQEGEPAELVKLSYIFDNPGIGGMTPAAIQANRLLVHVGVTGGAFIPGSGKNKGRMAVFAAYPGVLPSQRVFRQVMVE